MSDEKVMVCARADEPMMAASSSFSKCGACGFSVMIAPTGQRFIQQNPETQLLCLSCYAANPITADEYALSAPVDDIVAEIRAAVPNPRADSVKRRN